LERVLAAGVHTYLDEYGKPTLTGEFGNGLSSSLAGVDPDGIHIHNGMWGSLMAGGLGTAMSWWWDIYIHPQDLYYHFSPIREVVDRVPFVKSNMEPGSGTVTGAAGDLDLSPSGDWGVVGADSITVNPDGSTTPTNPSLSTYLYGSQFNTDFRSPPVFTVDYPEAGAFTVHTASTKGTSPRIAIWVDGTKVLDKSARTSQSYSVSISAGPHTIKVDNTGMDWITISSYSFSGLGSTTDFYVLTSADGDVSAGWILNNEYHYLNVPQHGPPTPVTDAMLTIKGMKDSSYFVKWFDCLTGAVIKNELVTGVNGEVSINVPPMIWDLAFVIDDTPEDVLVTQDLTNFNIKAYPNPGKRGQLVTITLPAIAAPKATIELLDMSGRQVMTTDRSGGRIYEVKIPEALAAGMYWWRVRSGSLIGTEAVLVTD
ncbi:MAG: T9SS type A sorting domain-containing protein, partial [Bacteroidia bacterium]|nr:T9SS type A sorting domain-containing protein [Bacteroidia bacterium]